MPVPNDVIATERILTNVFPTHIDVVRTGVSASLFSPIVDLYVYSLDTAWDDHPSRTTEGASPPSMRVGIAQKIFVGTIPTLDDPSGGASGGGWIRGLDNTTLGYTEIDTNTVASGSSSGTTPPYIDVRRQFIPLPEVGFKLTANQIYALVFMHKSTTKGFGIANYVNTREAVPLITWDAETSDKIVRVDSLGHVLPNPVGGASGSLLVEVTQHATPFWGTMVDSLSTATDFTLFGSFFPPTTVCPPLEPAQAVLRGGRVYTDTTTIRVTQAKPPQTTIHDPRVKCAPIEEAISRPMGGRVRPRQI